MNPRLPTVLMYHSVAKLADGPDPLCTSPERFEAQMLYLKRRNLRGVSVQELRRELSAGSARGLVGLTFDDGYEDFLHTAVPVLERLGFSATVFVVAGMPGEENSWEHRGGPRPRLKLLETAGIREVSERGMEVGSHTMTHPRLSDLDPEALIHEVSNSQRVIEEVVGKPVQGFCYPYGDLNAAAVRAVRETGYAYACATKKRVERSIHDWPRTYVGEKDFPLRLGVKLTAHRLLTRS